MSRRFMGRRGRDDDDDMDISNLLAIYNATKSDEKERDDKITDLDVSFQFIETCLELIEKRPDIAYKYISMPKIHKVLMFIAKCQHSVDDKTVQAYFNLLREFYDDVIYFPDLKDKYITFLKQVFNRVDQDSKTRGEMLQILKNAGKKMGGVITEVTRDAKNYARSRINQNIENGEGDDTDDEDEVFEDDDDLFLAIDSITEEPYSE